MKTPEEVTERRLELEAKRLMKRIVVEPSKPVVNVAKVEVTWQLPGDKEHSGHLIVNMPEDVDPWETAREQAYGWLESLGELEYSMVDDIYSV